MRKLLRGLVVVVNVGWLGATALAADMTWTYAVQLSAAVNADPARVELTWTTDPFPVRHYTVHRKAPGAAEWNEGITLGSTATGYIDEAVELGKIYEYQVIRHAVAYTAYGYAAVGINAPLNDARGRVVLVVDRTMAEPLTKELKRFESDLAGDGWTVVRRDVARDASPAEVKAQIRAVWEADRERTQAVILFGHIPVVHSGHYNVDGHGARPMPADTFYGDPDGEWTDADGDGIYDQNVIPSDVEVMVGRVDFANLPGRYSPVRYPDEVELLRRYLDKNHAFRQAAVRPARRALIGNAIGDANGQGYAAAGYRSFAPLLGSGNVITGGVGAATPENERWVARLGAGSYLWAFGCGGGSDFTVGGLGPHGAYADLWASDFIEHKAKGTFYLMFGSWFSEWQKPDNVLRTALASPEFGLTASWAGRPHQFYHYMGVGEPIGAGLRLSQNNGGLYQNQVQRQLRGVHIALMGDPTLRMHIIAPPTEVAAAVEGGGVVVTWKASPDSVLGYHVYRGASTAGPFTRVSAALVAEPFRFVDTRPSAEEGVYQVRAVALNASPSGSFYNASQGAFPAGVVAGTTAVATAPRPEPVTADATKAGDVVWFDDAMPAGAIGYAENDRWNWVSANPAPFSGDRAHQADSAPGRHHHFFAFASNPLVVNPGDTLFAYVYLDPTNPPRQVLLTWLAGTWEHRAYWGENLIAEGADNTAARRPQGPLPATGRWVRLEVPAAAVGLENEAITGMGFTLFDGRATWDRVGKSRP